jgi:hypothetical protein
MRGTALQRQGAPGAGRAQLPPRPRRATRPVLCARGQAGEGGQGRGGAEASEEELEARRERAQRSMDLYREQQ